VNKKEAADFLSSKNAWLEIFDALEIPKTVDYLHNLPTAERWLCACRGGNTRSAAVAFLLKYKYMKDALTVSLEKNSPSTLNMLLTWAQRVVVTEPGHMKELGTLVHADLIDLTTTARLRAHPYEIPFLLEIDKKLKEIL
jgi:hypothetical protein